MTEQKEPILPQSPEAASPIAIWLLAIIACAVVYGFVIKPWADKQCWNDRCRELRAAAQEESFHQQAFEEGERAGQRRIEELNSK